MVTIPSGFQKKSWQRAAMKPRTAGHPRALESQEVSCTAWQGSPGSWRNRRTGGCFPACPGLLCFYPQPQCSGPAPLLSPTLLSPKRTPPSTPRPRDRGPAPASSHPSPTTHLHSTCHGFSSPSPSSLKVEKARFFALLLLRGRDGNDRYPALWSYPHITTSARPPTRGS